MFLNVIRQQIPQQVSLAQGHHIGHRQAGPDDLVQQLAADPGHHSPLIAAEGSRQIGLHHLLEGRGIRRAAELLPLPGCLQIVDIADQISQHTETAVAEAPTAPRDPEENSASAPGEGETLPMLRPAFDEMSSQFTREFTALAAKFEELERERRRMFRRMWFAGLAIMAAALLLLLLLGAALWTLHGKFERSKAESTAAMATLTRDGEKLSGQLESIRAEQRRETEKLGVMLDRSRADFQRNAERLGSELAEQRKGFEHRIAELSADAEKKLQTETLRLKEEFARKQQQELREQAAAYEKKLREAEAGVAAAKGDADRARKESDELRHRLEQLEKSRSAEVESPGAAK